MEVAFNILNTQNRFVYSILELTYRLTDPFLKKIRRFYLIWGSRYITNNFTSIDLVYRNVYEALRCTNNILKIMILIDGKKEAALLREELKKEVLDLKLNLTKYRD